MLDKVHGIEQLFNSSEKLFSELQNCNKCNIEELIDSSHRNTIIGEQLSMIQRQ